MCGITGFISKNTQNPQQAGTEMARCMIHRGPDSQGVWQEGITCLAHARLSILDLSEAGNQPMLSSCERYSMIFNGEIYNHIKLRSELPGHNYRGHSDTETLLEAFSNWGIEKTLNKINGMFAIAIWDRTEKKLHLIRDRIGIKPLYYGWVNNSFVFGSELKPLKRFPGFNAKLCQQSLALYLRYNYIPCPFSVYDNIFKLTPGCWLTVNDENKPTAFSPIADSSVNSPKTYWSLQNVTKNALSNTFGGSVEEAEEELDSLLALAVSERMISDVPLGAFLSGGIDSSLTVAMMQKTSAHPVKTFTIGNDDKFYDEAIHAREVARHLGTDHTELYITSKDALSVVPQLAGIYDEPFADSSQIPTYLVSKLARQKVTVALSGDGGDELFAGYRRHFQAAPFWHKTQKIPAFIRKSAEFAARLSVNSGFINTLARYAPFLLPASFKSGSVTDSVLKAADVIGSNSIDEYYHKLISQNQRPLELLRQTSEPCNICNLPDFLDNDTRKMQYLDLIMYHPDDILVKVDRASMANSLEARVPLIDYRLVEFSARLPLKYLINEGKGKYLLRRVLHRYVPEELINRPKMGFSIPLAQWLRSELREWCEELLDRRILEEGGIFAPKAVENMWKAHLSGKYDYKYQLWAVLMLQNWIKNYA